MSNIKPVVRDFSSFDVKIVESGTEIEVMNPATKQFETVIITDDDCIFHGREMFVTQVMYDRIKHELSELSPELKPGRLQ